MKSTACGIVFVSFYILMPVASSAEVSCRQLEFRASESFEGKRLMNHTIRTIEHVQGDFCGALCFMENNCVSFNTEITSGSKTATKCELNNATHREHPDDLKLWNNFVYTGINNPCGPQNPCPSNANCQAGFTDKGYRCLCPPGFSGEHCENDIDECSVGHSCGVNAVCNNTKGSYKCTCNEGYYGDGKNCTAGESCLMIKAIDGERAISGIYWLFLNGDKFLTYCHMDSTGASWTLIARFANTPTDAINWMIDSGEWWYDKTVPVGETIDPSHNTDMVSPAFWQVSGKELKITRSDDPQQIALLQTTGDCLGGQTFRSKMKGYGVFRDKQTFSDSNGCRGSCDVQYGGQYNETTGFQQAGCNGEIQSANKISFWCVYGYSGSVVMIGGGGFSCDRSSHGLGITVSKLAAFYADSGRPERDFGDSPYGSSQMAYSLNLWIN